MKISIKFCSKNHRSFAKSCTRISPYNDKWRPRTRNSRHGTLQCRRFQMGLCIKIGKTRVAYIPKNRHKQLSLLRHDFYHFTKTAYRFHLQNITYQGLTDFKLRHISTRPKDLKFVFAVLMEAIQLQGPYKLNGHAFKQWLPIYGDGDLM